MEYLGYATKLLWCAAAIPAVNLGLLLYKGGRKKLATAELGNKKSLKGLIGEDGIQISKSIILNQKASFEHVSIIAPTGAGKTTSVFIPNLLQDNIKGSIIISDPKGELYRLTHKYQESIGRKTILYKPLEKGTSYNPLSQCKSDREVIQLSQNLLINGALSLELQTGKKASGIEWLQMAQSLFAATLLYFKGKGTISDALKFLIFKNIDEINETFENSAQNIRTQYNIFKQCLLSPKTYSSIKITLGSNLQLFTDKLSITHTDFNSEQLRKKPIALYISYPENKSSYLAPYMACFYSQFIDHLIDIEGLPIYFFFDEFANIGMLQNFSTNISTARSRQISFTICLQSITQLQQIYGRDNALSILNNCKTKVVLPGSSDIETLKFISELCGDKEIETQSSNEKGTTKSQTTRKLFTEDEIRRLKDDELLCIINNRLPQISEQNIYYKQDKYTSRI